MKYACIAAHQEQFEVRLMCRVLEVHRSGFYAWKKRGPSVRDGQEERLRTEIRAVHRTSRRNYGSPRVHAQLQAQGIHCGRKRVERLMREEGLRAKGRWRFRVTTDSSHAHPIAPNRLNRQFGVEEVGGCNRVWVGDITYLPTREGWLYLAVVLDLGSRSVVGWSMRTTLESALAVDALEMALQRRHPGQDLLHHSDRGVQYASGEYRDLLAQAGMACSMSRKGNCWDNAVAESFFATLEKELGAEADWHTREEARRDVFEYIEVWYNRQRLHSALGYKSPAEYEAQLALTPRAA